MDAVARDRAADEARDTGGATHAERVATFLEFACWDHTCTARPTIGCATGRPARLLAQHPEIASDSLFTAVVCGELAEVERRARGAPRRGARARRRARAGRRCSISASRASAIRPVIQNAVAIAPRAARPRRGPERLLHGRRRPATRRSSARPARASRMRRGSRQARGALRAAARARRRAVRHPGALQHALQRRRAVVAGARALAHAAVATRAAAWHDPDWPMFDMGGYGSRRALPAVDRHSRRTTGRSREWVLAHGANPNAPPRAIRASRSAASMKTRLAGARPRSPNCCAPRREPVRVAIERRGGVRRRVPPRSIVTMSDAPLAAAPRVSARRRRRSLLRRSANRADVVALLLDLGVADRDPR